MGETERRRRRTIIGLVVFLVVTVVVFWIILPMLTGRPDFARLQRAADDLADIQGALSRFEADCGHLPDTQDGLRALYEQPARDASWAGPYISKERTVDPWGRAYVYTYPSTAWGRYDLKSFGADGAEGGTGSGADVAVDPRP